MSPREIEKIGIGDSVSWRLGKVTQKPAFFRRAVRKRQPTDRVMVSGLVIARLFGPDGRLKALEAGRNLVTDHGDEHIGERIALDTQDIVSGMRLGDQVAPAAASKSGAGSAIQQYLTGSNEALDAVAVGSDLGGGAGWRQQHVCTWVAGDITDPAISETVLTDETPLTDVAGVAGNTVARFVFPSTIDKQAGDSLEVTWNIDTLGA